MMRGIPIFFLVTFAVVLLNSVSLADDTLTPQQPLLDSHGTTLLDAGNRFELGFFTSNDSSYRYVGIWFYNISPRTVVWVANRRSPLPDLSGRLSLTTNGTLLLTSDNSTIVFWSSRDGSAPLRKPVARLLDNGNFVVGEEAEQNGYVAWQSYDHPTDTILPGMRFGRNMTSGLNLNLTAWTSLSDPTPGDYVVGIDMDGLPEQILWQRRIPLWRSGPWNGLYLSGGPEMVAENLVQYHFTVASQQFIYTYTIRDNSLPARITLIPSGELQVLIWVVDNQEWSVRGYSPRDPCDFLSACGLNAICIPNRSPMCNCLTGFKPKNSTNWNILRDWSGGCVRNTELDCRNRTDGFFNQSNLKLPETSSAVMRASLTLAECGNLCLNDCNCTAYASANVNGSGCILWTSHLTDIRFFFGGMGQDLYVRLAAADLNAAYAESRPSNKRRVGVIVAVTLAASFLLSCAAFCIWRWKTKKSFVGEETEEQDLDLPLFDLDTIVNATGNFSTGNKLGEGGFGPVYKGRLSEGQEIAVKRLSKTSSQGVNEFKNEVQLIAKLQHRSLVRLLGCCVEAGERMLIYEYLSNGSLDTFLFDEVKSGQLDWKLRYNIIVGIARGLLYLHHDSRFIIIHRDLKASNILLDQDMNPKISDFGMARILDGDENAAKTKRIVGTYGYMPPEYIKNGRFSIKSDIFSFGVLILEIISGKRNTEVFTSDQHLNLLDYVWRLWRNDKALELIDETICPPFSMEEVMRCINIGLLCVQERCEDRPIVTSILLMLLGSDNTSLPEPRQPGFVSRDLHEGNSSSIMKYTCSNQVSVTILEAR
ncbi:receptor-like serine/threonine-protein kinase SD1-8 [Zingiber officinale]|uniref:receptor-like serine/threonine-protein kinase SD1-8 n=1 Tax=Zingiber officinale TaxID=94328 RepID=UPI001C4D18AA|nr:receptor-like serine/threonine-protein kinase SD1-8 [Zingiber officinale]